MLRKQFKDIDTFWRPRLKQPSVNGGTMAKVGAFLERGAWNLNSDGVVYVKSPKSHETIETPSAFI